MVSDFRRRFWVSLILTVPVLAVARHIQGWLGLGNSLAFPGDTWAQFVLASAVYFYGGWPFLAGLIGKLRKRQPGMMTLIGLAITVPTATAARSSSGSMGRTSFGSSRR
jgi:P-type Cu2+ transporter